jgi:hypothetical protein
MCEEVEDNDLCLDSDVEKKMSSKPSAKKTKAKSRLSSAATDTLEWAVADSDCETSLSKSKAKLNSFSFAGASSGTLRSSSVGQYDGNDSFIDDDVDEDAGRALGSVPRRHSKSQGAERGLEDDLSSLASLRSPVSPNFATKQDAGVTKRFFVSQESIDYDAMDDELPDLEDLVSNKKGRKTQPDNGQNDSMLISPNMPTVRKETEDAEKSNARSRKRARRIFDSDDDE